MLLGTFALVACSNRRSDVQQESLEINNEYNRKPVREDGGVSNRRVEEITKDTIRDTVKADSEKKNAKK